LRLSKRDTLGEQMQLALPHQFLMHAWRVGELLPPFPLWLLLGYYAIVVGGWLWNQWLMSHERGGS
jgi:hypothetical protein